MHRHGIIRCQYKAQLVSFHKQRNVKQLLCHDTYTKSNLIKQFAAEYRQCILKNATNHYAIYNCKLLWNAVNRHDMQNDHQKITRRNCIISNNQTT